MARVLDKEGNRDGGAGSLTEHIVTLSPACLASSPGVSTEVDDVDVRELLHEAQPHAVGGVGVDEATVGDEADHPGPADPVARPAQRPHVGVVEGVLVGGRGAGRVGPLDPGVERGVGLVRVVVVRGGLPHRVGRVAHDDLDVQVALGRSPLVVGHEDALVQRVVVLRRLEGVRQHDPGERRVPASAAVAARAVTGGHLAAVNRASVSRAAGCVVGHEVVVGHLDVRRRDVVGQEQDLVGVQLTRILAHQVRRHDEPRLQQADHEGPRPRERVQDVHALVRHPPPQVRAGEDIHTTQDEVHHRRRRVHDAQGLRRAREGRPEELLVELGDDPLLAGCVVDPRAALPHRGVEAVQLTGLGLQVGAVQHPQHPAHHPGHRVLRAEVVAVEQRVEDRLGDEVLGEHVHRSLGRHRVVEVGPQGSEEAVELLGHGRFRYPRRQALAVARRDVGDVLGPVLPVAARAHLLHEPRVDGLPPLAQGVQVEDALGAPGLRAAGAAVASLGAVGRVPARGTEGVDDRDLVRCGPVEVDLVDHRVEALVVGAQRLEHLPDHAEGVVVLEDVLRPHPGGDGHRQDDVAVALARRQPHDTPHRLDDVHLGLAWGQEHHRVQRRDVHALGQAPGVGQHPAGRRAQRRVRIRRGGGCCSARRHAWSGPSGWRRSPRPRPVRRARSAAYYVP